MKYQLNKTQPSRASKIMLVLVSLLAGATVGLYLGGVYVVQQIDNMAAAALVSAQTSDVQPLQGSGELQPAPNTVQVTSSPSSKDHAETGNELQPAAANLQRTAPADRLQ